MSSQAQVGVECLFAAEAFRALPFDVRVPNALTARTLNVSKAGKGAKRFGSKKALYADLGL